ncbi:MAG: nucleoside transporter C-terminal domain-containing protein [Deltaproteobacteria bacterium]|nr:nucleoside transporter C-terminal domain-containing protein [Deltaproteobacteria bacterium]
MGIFNVVSFCGIFVLLLGAWLLSADRRKVNKRLVLVGLILDLALGAIVFLVPGAAKAVLACETMVSGLAAVASTGAAVLFGKLSTAFTVNGPEAGRLVALTTVFQVFPRILLFAMLASILYLAGFFPWLVRLMSRAFSRRLGLSGMEATCVVTNLFTGVSSLFVARPALGEMTRSELCTVLAVGMSAFSSNAFSLVLARAPGPSGAHLVASSLLALPAALVVSKILLPESGIPRTLDPSAELGDRPNGLLAALTAGTRHGLRVIVAMTAFVLASVAAFAVLNLLFALLGRVMNPMLGMAFDWSIQGFLTLVFYPLAVLTGVSPADAFPVAQALGQRVVTGEAAAVQDLFVALQEGRLASQRSVIVAAYAMAGGVNMMSFAVFTGATAALVPERTREILPVAARAFLAAAFASLIAAAVAGTFFISGLAPMAK